MVRRIFQKTSALIGKQQTSILSAATIIMAMVATSRILGLVRDRLLTDRFTSGELGVYFAAFRLPNLVFELIVMGAVSTAFIPVFTSYRSAKSPREAFHLASSVINIGLVCFFILSLLFLIFTPQIVTFIAPGFNKDELAMLISFTRIMLLAQVFPLIIGNFFTGMLQSYQQFIIPALAPVVYNVGIILGIIILTPALGLYAPVFGVVVGALLFMFIQIPSVVAAGYRHDLSLDWRSSGVRQVGKLMLPRTLGLAVSQIDSTVDLILASLLGARSVTIFNLAQHLQHVPIGLFGASLAQAALPTLAILHAQKSMEEFKTAFLSTFHQILFFSLPAAVLLIVLRIPIVRLVFGASRFDWPDTVDTGRTLAYFALSLFAQAHVHLLARAFYSLYDSKTPVILGGISVILNAILSIVFIQSLHLPVWGLALAASIASLFNAFSLLYFLDRITKHFDRKKLILPIIKMFIASALTGIALYIPMKLLDQLVFDTTRTIQLLLLTGVASLSGLSVYTFLAWFLDIGEVGMFFTLAKKVMRVRQPILETSAEVINSESSQL